MIRIRSRRLAARLLAAACVAIAAGALAQPLPQYDGPGRLEKLAAAAKREGEVTIYTSTPVEDIKVLTDAFERKYGIRTNVWRASSEKVLQRGTIEARAGRFDVDVFETNGPELEVLAREKLLAPVETPAVRDLVPEAVLPHRQWIGTRLVIFAFAYNTSLVQKSELPRTYEGFADPRWKGRLGIEAEDHPWFGTLLANLKEPEGAKLFRDIVSANGISVRKGHTLLATLVAAGEVPLGLTVYSYKPQQLKEKGAAIDWLVIPPAIASLHAVAVPKSAPHPHAAALLYDFFLSEGQALLAEKKFVPSSRKIASPMGDTPIIPLEPGAALDNNDAWLKTFQETFIRRAN